jgi:hypothetical protein
VGDFCARVLMVTRNEHNAPSAIGNRARPAKGAD